MGWPFTIDAASAWDSGWHGSTMQPPSDAMTFDVDGVVTDTASLLSDRVRGWVSGRKASRRDPAR